MSIVDAILNSDPDGLLVALSRIGSEDEADVNGWTGLHWAVECENLTCIEILIRATCKVDAQNIDGATALSLACYKRNPLLVVQTLLEACQDSVYIGNNDGITPLMIASSYSDTDVVKLLINYGSDVNARDNKNKTALWHAKSCLRFDVEEILLQAGADRNTGLLNVLDAARFNYSSALREAIERGCPIDEVDEFGNSALHHVAQDGNLACMKLLLRAGCPPSRCNKYGETPLFVACFSGSTAEIVETLLQADPNSVNICNNVGVYPLMEASTMSDVTVVEALVAGGAEINILKDGYSALWDAQVGNRMDIYHFLLQSGANPMIGCDLSFYVQYLFRLWRENPNATVELLNIQSSRHNLFGDVRIKTSVEILHDLLDIKEFAKALTGSGVNVHYLDVNDPREGFGDALTMRFENPQQFLRLWLASQSCAIEPNMNANDCDTLCLKSKCRSLIRSKLAHQVRSERKFELVLRELEIPVDLQLYIRYLQ